MESGSPGVGFSYSEALRKLTSSSEGTGSSELIYNKENGMRDHDT